MGSIIHSFELVVAFALLVRFADLAISSAITRDIIRAMCYGIAAIFLLVFAVLQLF